jgi:type IV pilus assembly protein PilC
MADFAYVVKSGSGEELSGHMNGGTVDEVVDQLHARGFVVLHVAEDSAGRRGFGLGARLGGFSIGSASTREVALFTRQLSTVVETGIPLVRGLRGLAADGTSKRLSHSVADIAMRVEKGQSLSEAMSAHPRNFGKMYVSMIRAGERAGTLDQILEQLAVYLEKMDAIQTKVRAAMSYPIFVLIFAFLATLFLLFKIVPTFEEIYSDLGQKLPGLTRAVITVSNAVRHNLAISAAIVLAIVVVCVLWGRTPPGRYIFHGFLIRVPIFGPIVLKAVMSRFARTFGILIGSGLPILDSLELVKGASGNAVVMRAIDQVKSRVGQGQGITSSFRSTGKFPEMVLQLMSTGEESGELDAMLIKTSDFYDRQVEAAVHGLTSLIEPVLIVLVGVMVGIIVVSMFLPIFYLGDAIMKGGYNY